MAKCNRQHKQQRDNMDWVPDALRQGRFIDIRRLRCVMNVHDWHSSMPHEGILMIIGTRKLGESFPNNFYLVVSTLDADGRTYDLMCSKGKSIRDLARIVIVS